MAKESKMGITDITKATKVFERAFRDVDPESMKDIPLTEEIRFAHWATIILRDLPSDHILVSLGPVAEAHRDRLWEEYKKRFEQGDTWLKPDRTDSGTLTFSGYQKVWNTPEAIRKAPLRELHDDVRIGRNPLAGVFSDPIENLQHRERIPAIRDRGVLAKAEIARRERRRKAA